MKLRSDTVAIPPAASRPFSGGIKHPDLWLWDAWTYWHDGDLHLFCLALAKVDANGRPITPGDRNDYPFHIREFLSQDEGASWRDLGVYLQPDETPGSPTQHSIWSGSALNDGDELLFGFTGIRQPAEGRSFLQSICLLPTRPGERPDLGQAIVLSDPERDYAEITKAGYYLGSQSSLGVDTGEEHGPILAWRDPFFVPEGDGTLRAYWAAKTGPAEPAIASGRVRKTSAGYVLDKLYAPIVHPDVSEYTQSEVPKVFQNPEDGSLLMLTSTCDRVSEDQPDSEVTKELRLYTAPGFDGPWSSYSDEGASLHGVEHLFGGEFSSLNLARQEATLIAPYTEMAEPDLQLTFAAPRKVSLTSLMRKRSAPAA